jgi:hypothetical protein
MNYNQIRDNVLQLSSQERIRLIHELEQHKQCEEDTKTKIPESDKPKLKELWRKDGMVCYRVCGDPIFSPEEIKEFKENRKRLEAETAKIPREEIEKIRARRLRAALALPTCSDEEWAEIKKMRKILRPGQPPLD